MTPRDPDQSDQHLLRAWLADRDAPCPGCGYNLRDLDGDRCPECGRPVGLQIVGSRLRVGALLLAFAPAVVGVTAAVLFLVMAIRYQVAPRRVDVGLAMFWLNGIACLAWALMLWKRADRFEGLADSRKRVAILLSWLAQIVTLSLAWLASS